MLLVRNYAVKISDPLGQKTAALPAIIAKPPLRATPLLCRLTAVLQLKFEFVSRITSLRTARNRPGIPPVIALGRGTYRHCFKLRSLCITCYQVPDL